MTKLRDDISKKFAILRGKDPTKFDSMALSVPWSEVEGHSFPGDEPTVMLAQLHSELSSRTSTTTNNACNNLH